MILQTPQEMREQGRKVAQQMAQNTEALDSTIRDLAKEIDNTDLAKDETSVTIEALLSLPDDKFALLAPIFLEEMEKTYNNSNNKLLLIKTMNLTGQTLESMREEYEQICDQIDEEQKSVSKIKRDFLKRMLGLHYNSISEADGIAKQLVMIPIALCDESAKNPAYAHLTDAGMDIYATEDITINPSETVLIHTGIKVAIPIGYEIQVRPKSGRSLNTKLRIANAPGTIDAGYRDEICIIADNIDPKIKDLTVNDQGQVTGILYGSSITIEKGEKIAQLVLSTVPKIAWLNVESVDEIPNDGRDGGFGSTGNK